MGPLDVLKNQKGSALIESLYGMILVLGFLGLLGSTTYLGWARNWIDHAAYEGSICLWEGRNNCRQQIQKHINEGLSFGKIKEIKEINRPSSKGFIVKWHWRNLIVHRKIRIPYREILKRAKFQSRALPWSY